MTRARPITTALAVLTTAAALGAGPGLLASPAGAADDTWAVPRQARVIVDGHGYGHGNGMSQHGAQGAARQGLGYRKIIGFYYPGTSWGTAGGRVKVQVTGDTTDDVLVAARPGLTVRSLGSGTTFTLPEGPDRWRLVATGGDTRVEKLRSGGGWASWRVVAGDAEFTARGPITLVKPSGSTAYRGRLRSVSVGKGRATVNVVDLEGYLKGVVPLEMPALWEPQAVRSQAVAARTYAAFERRSRAGWFDVYDTTASQVYGGASAEHPASNDAVRSTRREVVTWKGDPAFTQFSASSGGWTSAGSQPYLVAQRDPYDDWDGNTHHDWRVALTDTSIERRWPALGNLRRITVLGREGNGEWGGRVEQLLLRGSRNDVRVSGDDFRFLLGLRSTWLTFVVRER
jgi:SpoIID/LytB domain protein